MLSTGRRNGTGLAKPSRHEHLQSFPACAPTEASCDETSAAVWRGPATHDASLVSHNIPATMRAGERLNVRVTVENTGASSPTDDWSAAEYYLRGAPGFPFGLKNKVIPQDAAVGESVDIDFVITAPAAGANRVLSVCVCVWLKVLIW